MIMKTFSRGALAIAAVSALALPLAGCNSATKSPNATLTVTNVNGAESTTVVNTSETPDIDGDVTANLGPAITPVAQGATIDGLVQCGVLNDGQENPLVITDSDASNCTVAMSALNRYLHDDSVKPEGNARVALVDGWTCSTSTAAVAAADGYAISCKKGDSEIRVLPAAPTPAKQ